MMYQSELGLGCVDAVQDLVHSAAGMAGLSRQRGLKKKKALCVGAAHLQQPFQRIAQETQIPSAAGKTFQLMTKVELFDCWDE